MKSDFINNITHELHTPLSAIIVANKSLQNEKIVEKKQNIRPLSDIIQRQAERLNALISQVLDIVSMDKLKLRKKEQSVHLLLEEILLDYRLQSAENFRLTFQKEAKKDVVPVDSFYFTTILQNILDNSIKYNTNKKKEITVSTKSDDHPLEISIRDNGIGMTTETVGHIFDKFYRQTNNLLNQTKGLGLGLYYVKQSIMAHNWKKRVESNPGNGSLFNIHIPFQKNQS
jgi:two-component system phosphate regulon sensor histidine kinase PhoR